MFSSWVDAATNVAAGPSAVDDTAGTGQTEGSDPNTATGSSVSEDKIRSLASSWWSSAQTSMQKASESAAVMSKKAAEQAQEMSKKAAEQASELSKNAGEYGQKTLQSATVMSSDILTKAKQSTTAVAPTEGDSDAAKVPAAAQGSFDLLGSIAVLGNKVRSTVDSMTEDWEKEQNKFLAEKEQARVFQHDNSMMPLWAGFADEESVKAQILTLSLDKRNFLVDPPAGNDFHFDLDIFSAACMSALKYDPRIETVRFELVPKTVKESRFWRNYLYRVSLIKQQASLSSMQSEVEVGASPKSNSSSQLTNRHSDIVASPPPQPNKLMRRTSNDTLSTEESLSNTGSEITETKGIAETRSDTVPVLSNVASASPTEEASALKSDSDGEDDFDVSDLDDLDGELDGLDIADLDDLDVDDLGDLSE
ncbi:hypothetical protein, variant [Sphaeroforma arctica JP610]|uniref:BSD domain-containing protein n=1 Tax=Sphaeroforma arctica JP610 TaxID=667725 RepID=A0A0L0FW22_9EUKA|nr:hypothetical protein, variant [Sphaeroforma arctica JP610]KNC81032.1 hypothetical protein, variant [Sphaeroforma arctica JP610]|eukprot:XP_014154934.1 hypothetical protein, variant [Sphaeroforma arctica JP610]